MPTREDMQRIVDVARQQQGHRLAVWAEKNGWHLDNSTFAPLYSNVMKYTKLYHNGRTIALLTIFGSVSKQYGGDWFIRTYSLRRSREMAANGFGVIQLEEALKNAKISTKA